MACLNQVNRRPSNLRDPYRMARKKARMSPSSSSGRSRAALRAYLTGLFAGMAATRYEPEEVWPHADGKGYSGRWRATMELEEGKVRHFRGFDLVLLDGDQITLNEVYTHDLPE